MFRVFSALLLVSLAFAQPTQLNPQLVQNGGFEEGLVGWNVEGQPGYTFVVTQNVYAGTRALATKPLTRPDYGITIPSRQGAHQEITTSQLSLDLQFSFAARVENHNSRTEVRAALSVKGTRTWTLMYFLAYDPDIAQGPRYSNDTARSFFLADISPAADPMWNSWLTFTRDVRSDFSSAFGSQALQDSRITGVEIRLQMTAHGSTFNTDVTTWDEVSLIQKQTVHTTVPMTTLTETPTQSVITPTTTQIMTVITTVTPPSQSQTPVFMSLPAIVAGALALVVVVLAILVVTTRRK